MSSDGRFAIVHNGIIENYESLKSELTAKGFTFLSETDTEVVVNLLDYYYTGDFREAVMKTVARLSGSYALGILCVEHPGTVYAVRNRSPLILGLGAGEYYFASDVTAFIGRTKTVIYLDDGEFAELSPAGFNVYDSAGRAFDPEISFVNWDVQAAEKGGFDHFMLKEIYEQPRALDACISPRVKGGKIELESAEELADILPEIRRIVIIACGSAYHAGVVGKYVIEKLARIPTEAVLASEFRYSDPIVDGHTLAIAISQSGETADTIAAMREAKDRGARVLAIVNVVGSTVAKLADWAFYTWAGPEIAVATTKGYTTQVALLDIIAVWTATVLGRISDAEAEKYAQAIAALPERAQRAIDLNPEIPTLAKGYYKNSSIFFIGRNIDYASCLEASLKLKEISYIHSESYAAGELKHGTIALISQDQPVIAFACNRDLFEKSMSNIQQVKARGAYVLSVALEGDRRILGESDEVIYAPETEALFMAIPQIIPMQLFAYYVAKEKGCDIDKPKNLAKSVTVE